jgi:hypothetical protein
MQKQKSRRTFAKFLMGSLIVTGLGHAGDELDQYWDQALKKSESVYGNRKVDLTLEAGLETEGVRIDGDQLTSSDGGFKGNIRFKVPIYSATQRMQREREKSDYLNRCAELIKTIRINQRVMKSLREKEKLLEATIQADGLEGVRNFYTAKSEYVEKEEEIGDAWRRLKALVQ